MLARNAQGVYWMGRYLERAEHLCRLLRLQVEALVDRPAHEIEFGWKRIYASLGRQPPGGHLDLDESDDVTLADSYTLADDLTFERSNPCSVWSCFALGRENARQMRNCISAEMWTCLNLAYLRLQGLAMTDVWQPSPESFYAETARGLDAFAGVAEVTMYRDEGWHFMRLGRFIERAQYAVALLSAQAAADPSWDRPPAAGGADADGADADADWTTLLHVYQAFDAYVRRYSVEVRPRLVLDLLAGDPLLPGSLRRSLEGAAGELAALGPGPRAGSSAEAERLAGRLCALVRYDWPDRESREERETLLRQVGDGCRDLHDALYGAYVDYPIDDAPAS